MTLPFGGVSYFSALGKQADPSLGSNPGQPSREVQTINRICNKCGEEKPLTNDYFARSKQGKDGYRAYCKECHRLYGKVKKGEEERKPDIVDKGDYYKVYSDSRVVDIDKDKLRKLKELYCDYKLTINQVCRKINTSRRDFHLIKTAFNITKDDVPYIDEDIAGNEIEELVNTTIERRKERYFLKLQEEEIKSLKREVEKYRKKDYYLDTIDSLLADHMEEFIQEYEIPYIQLNKQEESNLLLEVPIVDLHLGKLAWKPETGENYDYKIAEKRFMFVINDIINRIQDDFEKVVIPIGNDFFNFDTIAGETTAGTRQDVDLRWQKLFNKGTEMLIKAIDLFSQIAPTKVFLVPGNHDKMTSFYVIKYLSAWYQDNSNITVNTDPKTRKYIEFGKNLIGFTHGDKEKKRIFGNMQVEAPEAWGRTRYREWHAAHIHSEQVKEAHGVIVRNLSSVTGVDCWHYESGYVSLAKSQSFIWHKEKGLRNIIMTNLEGG